jgi:hypothetical protein
MKKKEKIKKRMRRMKINIQIKRRREDYFFHPRKPKPELQPGSKPKPIRKIKGE